MHIKAPADLQRPAREAADGAIFRLCHSGHVHVTAACRIDDVDNLWLPLRCDLRKKNKSRKHSAIKQKTQTETGANHN